MDINESERFVTSWWDWDWGHKLSHVSEQWSWSHLKPAFDKSHERIYNFVQREHHFVILTKYFQSHSSDIAKLNGNFECDQSIRQYRQFSSVRFERQLRLAEGYLKKPSESMQQANSGSEPSMTSTFPRRKQTMAATILPLDFLHSNFAAGSFHGRIM
ncbi:hypothetical protein C0J52_07462 [Blattella germanica]|nr:hypothetical protein C0J52_07462 [Blattella germanica]